MSADSQKHGKGRSGGQLIDDHSFWAGSRSKDSVFPDGPHKCKDYSSAEGAASLMKYEQTSEDIHGIQEMAKGKAKGRPIKAGTRN